MAAHAPGLEPARVVEEQRSGYRVMNEAGEWSAESSGRLRHESAAEGTRPCVGDWVLVRRADSGPAIIHAVLERRTQFSRGAPGTRTAEQVVAANADTVFIVQSLNRDLNLRRLERYLALIWESGALPVVLLSKADLCDDPAARTAEVAAANPGVSVHVTSSVTGDGLDSIRAYLAEGVTVALVGSSGVGKSSIVNRLLGQELLTVRDIREDDRGRHTTTFRRLVPIPGGGLLMDTPGMRTVLLWDGAEGLSQVFEEIEELGRGCRFRDCSHDREPGCAVREAAESGVLDLSRLLSYRKLRREERYMARKQDVAVRLADSRKWRVIHRAQRARPDKRSL